MNETTGTARNTQATVRAVLDARRDMPGALLPILHDIQDQLGYVPKDAVADIAEALNLSRAEVHGVITYYHHFRTEAPKDAVVQVCRAEACQSCGSEALWEHANKRVAGQNVTLESVYCLGLCATAPSLSINDQPYARVSHARFDKLLAQLQSCQKEAA
jgi:formate dehydrogenase subunit gamma